MAVTHETDVRNAIADLVVDRIDLGSTNATGQLVLRASNDAAVATHNFANPAFGAAASGVATADAIADATGAAVPGGTTDRCTIEDRDNNTVWNGSVGLTGSGEDVELSSVVINANDTVQISNATYTAPA